MRVLLRRALERSWSHCLGRAELWRGIEAGIGQTTLQGRCAVNRSICMQSGVRRSLKDKSLLACLVGMSDKTPIFLPQRYRSGGTIRSKWDNRQQRRGPWALPGACPVEGVASPCGATQDVRVWDFGGYRSTLQGALKVKQSYIAGVAAFTLRLDVGDGEPCC